MRTFKHMLMEEAGAPSLLGGGGAPPAPEGEAPAAPPTPEWLTGVDTEWANDPSMKSIQDINSLAKSYVHAQKMVGQDKVSLPSNLATPEDWRTFYHKVGLPEKAEDYGVALGEDSHSSDEYISAFSEKAYELGILPAQAQELLNWQDGVLGDSDADDEENSLIDFQEAEGRLREDFGEAYEAKISQVSHLIHEVGGPELMASIEESGLGGNEQFIRMMVGMADKFTKEDSFDVRTNPLGTMTPEEAQQKINSVYGNKEHPYNNSGHASHADAIKEMQRLFKFTV